MRTSVNLTTKSLERTRLSKPCADLPGRAPRRPTKATCQPLGAEHQTLRIFPADLLGRASDFEGVRADLPGRTSNLGSHQTKNSPLHADLSGPSVELSDSQALTLADLLGSSIHLGVLISADLSGPSVEFSESFKNF